MHNLNPNTKTPISNSFPVVSDVDNIHLYEIATVTQFYHIAGKFYSDQNIHCNVRNNK